MPQAGTCKCPPRRITTSLTAPRRASATAADEAAVEHESAAAEHRVPERIAVDEVEAHGVVELRAEDAAQHDHHQHPHPQQ